MEIILGKTSGFCAGVKNAVENAQKEVEKTKGITYCLGELVHNKQVVEELESKGLKTIENIEEAKSKTIIRAHGVPKRVYQTAEKMGIELIDLTCPKVKKIHNLVEEYSNNRYFVFCIGNSKHPEIIGIQGFGNKNFYVIETLEDIENAITKLEQSNLKKLLVISQTTFNSKKFDIIINNIKQNLPANIELEIHNTICKATELRQKETEELSKTVDLMIIIGGKNSSNTNKLYEIASNNCKKAIFIQTKQDIDLNLIKDIQKIGIMAGASTPKNSVDDVIKYLQEKGN